MARPSSGYALADGTKVPGVTTVIKTLGDAEGLIYWAWKLGKEGADYRAVKQKAADIGTLTHDLIEHHLRGLPGEPAGAEDAKRSDWEKACRAFDAWHSWFAGRGIMVEPFERPLVSERYGFGGTPDALGQTSVNVIDILPDWKTSKRLYPEYLAQLGGYAILLAENGVAQITRATILRADKESDMTWETVELDEQQLQYARDAFLAALGAYQRREGLKKMLGGLQK